VKVRTVP